MGLAEAAIGDTGGALGAEYVCRLRARALLSQVDSVYVCLSPWSRGDGLPIARVDFRCYLASTSIVVRFEFIEDAIDAAVRQTL
jgi:hypothetical protein